MFKLFLDDMRIPSDVFNYIKDPMYLESDWTIVRNYDEFIWAIKEFGIPDVISFDHDLADEHYGMQENIEYGFMTEKTGFHCAQWFLYHCIDNKLPVTKRIYIHSMNPAGAQNIKSLFDSYHKIYG